MKKPEKKDADAQKPANPSGIDTEALAKEYNMRLKQFAQDKRAAPTERTKTEEEQAEEASKRLKELEEKRLKRMRGEIDSDEEEDEDDRKKGKKAAADDNMDISMNDADVDEFGLGKGIKLRPTATELGFDDEDDFELDDDLIASGSDLEWDEDEDEEGSDEEEEEESDEEENEFISGLLPGSKSKDGVLELPRDSKKGDDEDGVPYTFPCPQTYDEMVQIFKDVKVAKLPVAVQRIRALYHPKLDARNKERLGNFSQALIQYIAALADDSKRRCFVTLESLSRHVHSLAKSFPIEVAQGYRTRIQEMQEQRPLALTVGDLITLTAIGTTFPTSDHFHQVVTPAMLSAARFLGQKIPQNLADYATGTYLSILSLQYQTLAKRYVPELMNFSLNTLAALAHEKLQSVPGLFPVHEPAAGVRIKGANKAAIRKLNCGDCQQKDTSSSPGEEASLKVSILSTVASILKAAAETWTKMPAFYETFQPAYLVLQHLLSKPNAAHLPKDLVKHLTETSTTLSRLLQLARVSRRPLELHHHKPLAIKTHVPKFEDSFDPDKHYDPDRERAELAKLRAEHKRERKGAMRELRKDASFMARENLRVKKEKDEAYEKKYKRLVAEIQGEEGHASNVYAREKEQRKKKAQAARR